MSIGNATYWIVMFQVNPVPLGAPGPIKLMVRRHEYEIACRDERATVHHPTKGKFIINSKKTFTNDFENSIYLICEVNKVYE